MSDNGKQFDNPKFRDFWAELRIKNYYSSPTHPQSNGQGRTLKAALKTKLENLKGKWVEYLLEVLWAYRTTRKSATQETSFALAFGIEEVAPIEVGLKSLRVEFANTEHNEEILCLNLDLLEEKREQVLKRANDRRVRPMSFKPGDLILKKLLLARKDLTHGKLGPNWEGLYVVSRIVRLGNYELQTEEGKTLPHSWNAEHLKRFYQ